MIHAPPQHGKSVIVAQRLPAWLLGNSPEMRVKLACYNQTHSEGFSKVVRRLMETQEYRDVFPDLRLARQGTVSAWSTAAREALADSQPSFGALGLETGFVGQGADLLIIDDPYSSPAEALSEACRRNVKMFWEETAKVRLTPDANVVVMFHRYHEDDLAGMLIRAEGLAENGGAWELVRYAAQCDDPANDPVGRAQGEYLSPRYPESFYLEQERANADVWHGQFQGKPIPRGGVLFHVDKLETVEAAPTSAKTCRAWDLAATEGSGDYTAGVKVAKDDDGIFYVVDVVRGQWDASRVRRELRSTAEMDGVKTQIRVPQDPGQAGKAQATELTRLLSGFDVKSERMSGSKEIRASPFAAQVNAGNVKLVRGAWNHAFTEELRSFPLGRHDDQVDAATDAFNELVRRKQGRGAVG